MKVLFFIAIGLLVGMPSVVADQGKHPNVLFIAVDDLKPVLGCYGDPDAKTPNIDRLAASGTLFLNAHCQQAVCGPSRASLLTGLRPDTTRVYDLKTRFRDILPDVVTLPQHFKQNGYEVVGIGKIFDPRSTDNPKSLDAVSWSQPYLHPRSLARKTQGYLAPPLVEQIQALQKAGLKRNAILEKIGKPWSDMADVNDEAYEDGAVAQRAVKLIQQLSKKETPFFLAVGFKKPHLPFNAPKKYWDMYDPGKFSLAEFQQPPIDSPEIAFQNSWELRSYNRCPEDGPFPPEQQRHLIHGYYACTSYVDAQVGKLLDAIDQAGVADHTIIILWGDHGWHLGDHGMWCKHTNYEQATRAPLMISVPFQKELRPGKTESPVEFVDIFPTLCELARIPTPDSLQGKSVVPILKEPTTQIKPFAVSQYPRNHGKGKQAMGYALRDKRYRFVQWRECGNKRAPGTGPAFARELYDYQTDPLEKKNLVDDPEYAEVAHRMEQQLLQFLREQGVLKEGERTDAPAASTPPPARTLDAPVGSFSSPRSSFPNRSAPAPTMKTFLLSNQQMEDVVILQDEFLISTNLWGARLMGSESPKFTFELKGSSRGGQPPSYRWNISRRFRAPIFPYVGYGDRMWGKRRKSTTPRLPIQLRDLGSCEIEYDLSIDTDNFRRSKGNLAVDVWLADQALNNDDSMRTEIMLWFDRQDQYPIGAKNHRGTYTFGGAQWDLYTGDLGHAGGTKVCTFIAQKPVYRGTIDFMIPLQIIRDQGHIDDDTYLGCFEMGNEIYQGTGATQINQMRIDIRSKGFPEDQITYRWEFDDAPYGKRYFRGNRGLTTQVKNEQATRERTVVVRFLPADTDERQVLYYEGGAENGLSIAIDKGKIEFANWQKGADDNRITRICGAIPAASPKKNRNPSYIVAAVTLSTGGDRMEAYLDGHSIGSGRFHGLDGGRGVSTIAFAPAAAKNSPDASAFFRGMIDEVFVLDSALPSSTINHFQ